MLESFMEDLLWEYPDDFFPRHGFKKESRQFTLSGAGRFDISFRDASKRLWVIEVKAVPIRLEVADQVYRYAQQLKEAHPDDAPIPAVVAPVINATVRDHFDRWGIEHFEISEATFRRVAGERGIDMGVEKPGTDAAASMRDRPSSHAKSSRLPYALDPLDPSFEGDPEFMERVRVAAGGEYVFTPLPLAHHGPAVKLQARNPSKVWPVHYVADGATLCDGRSTQMATPNMARARSVWKWVNVDRVTCRICERTMPP